MYQQRCVRTVRPTSNPDQGVTSMANPLLTRCPICEGELQATRLSCVNCHGQVEGNFDLGGLLRLSREQGQFVELLVKNRGNINRVADELGVSYTTARNR